MQKVPESDSELYSVSFTSNGGRASSGPWVGKLIDYELTATGGHITFDGYYYVDDKELPRTHTIDFSKREAKPYKVVDGTHHYNIEFVFSAEIEIHEREIFKITDVISTIEDEDGEEMNVCFFPTKIQRLHFSVLKLHHISEGVVQGSGYELIRSYGKIKIDK